jgi:peptidoglycan hydrolase-like protein with peptidoglycan-binding domain
MTRATCLPDPHHPALDLMAAMRTEVLQMKPKIQALTATAAVSVGLLTGIAAVPAMASTAGPGVSAVSVSATAAVQTLQPWPVLSQGSNSSWPLVTVRSLQYLLNAHGAKLAVDGLFGPKTKAAVVTFQRYHGLAATGVVNTGTWRSLMVTVRQGSVGPAVRAVQDQINFRNNKDGRTLAVDGIFGPKTATAVKTFQRAMSAEVTGFAVDGIVGPQTWQALVTEALSG